MMQKFAASSSATATNKENARRCDSFSRLVQVIRAASNQTSDSFKERARFVKFLMSQKFNIILLMKGNARNVWNFLEYLQKGHLKI